jgi:hypothetical protein
MSSVSGSTSSMPGSFHKATGFCDKHPERLAVKRLQGETDSMGAEYHDMCQLCYDIYRISRQSKSNLLTGICDSCKIMFTGLRARRDYEEGSCGRVYKLCTHCITELVTIDHEEDSLSESDFDLYYED